MLRQLLKSVGHDPDKPLPAFRPLVHYHRLMDTLCYLDRDCTHTGSSATRSAISVFRDTDNDEIVGVSIERFSEISRLTDDSEDLVLMEKNVPCREEQAREESHLFLRKDIHGEVVGVRIEGFSKLSHLQALP